jgi:hypothetical protein
MIHKLICNILKIEIYNDEIIKNIIKWNFLKIYTI